MSAVGDGRSSEFPVSLTHPVLLFGHSMGALRFYLGTQESNPLDETQLRDVFCQLEEREENCKFFDQLIIEPVPEKIEEFIVASREKFGVL